jgi:DNA-binding GntR family transcriptional regulator
MTIATEHQPEDSVSFGLLSARGSLRDEVVRTLQAAIVSGEMRPGITYSAPQLADQLGISPTPVREAMVELANEGLVTAVRNKGFRVVELSDTELDELTDLRRLIEIPSVRQIAERGIDAHVHARLVALAEQITAAARQRDFVGHNKLDLDFHALLLAQAGNANLVSVVTSLRTRSRLYGAADLVERDELEPMLHEHFTLLEFIDRRDADGAAELMALHLDHVRREWAGPSGMPRSEAHS